MRPDLKRNVINVPFRWPSKRLSTAIVFAPAMASTSLPGVDVRSLMIEHQLTDCADIVLKGLLALAFILKSSVRRGFGGGASKIVDQSTNLADNLTVYN